ITLLPPPLCSPFFFSRSRPLPALHSFPTRRSSDLVIRLAVLVDRGGRELPIQPDFVALTLSDVPKDHRVNVHFDAMILRDVTERSEEHTSELQSPCNLVCRLLLEKKKKKE